MQSRLSIKKKKQTPLFFDATCIVRITVGSAAVGEFLQRSLSQSG